MVDAISATWENIEPIDVEELSTTLEKIRFKFQQPPTDWDPTKRPSEEALAAARTALIAVQERLKSMPPATASQALDAFQRGLMADFAAKWTLLQHNVHPTRTRDSG